ncbi:MAG: PAS domain S-box protein, partial [Firmicutes bacterium]|nr:PAS domain S-box protein [Bacillota bacterium]
GFFSDGDPDCEKCRELGYETTILVPLKAAGEDLGLIHLYDCREKAVSPDKVAFLETISSPLAYALKHLQDKESIRRNEEQFRFLAENARDIIFRLQIFPVKKFVYVSPASLFISGYSPEEYYADEAFDKRLVHPADYPMFKSCINCGTAFSKPIVLRFIRKDGRVIWVELHCTSIYNKGRVEIIEGIARDITERIHAEQELKSSYDQLKTFSSMILRAQEEEKIRLSRELHDEVGQALTAVKIDLQVVKKKLKEKNLGFQKRLRESVNLVDSTLELVRKQAVSLRPPALDYMGLVAAVQNMAQGFARRTGIEAKVTATDETIRFSGDIETALFRCIQESLTNVARHSGAERVTIAFKYLADSIHVCIKDNGKGFDQDVLDGSSGRLGITGMRERVKLLNGVFEIDSQPRSGTCITIKIPLT